MNRNKKGPVSQKSPPIKKGTKGVPKKKQQKVGKGRVSATSIFGSTTKYSSTRGELPSAFVNLDSNSTQLKLTGSVRHAYEGIDGVSYTGCQPFSTVSMAAATIATLTNGTLATISSDSAAVAATICFLSPDNLNGRIAAMANLYSRFVFRDVVIEYVSNCATTQADSFCLAYVQDAAVASTAGPTTFAQLRQVLPSITIPYRTDRAYFHFHYDGMDLFYNKQEAATTVAGSRSEFQGALMAYADKSAGNVASLGYTNIWYTVEFFNPVSDQSITMRVRDRDEESAVAAFLSQYRSSTSSSSSSSTKVLSCPSTPSLEVRNGKWVSF